MPLFLGGGKVNAFSFVGFSLFWEMPHPLCSDNGFLFDVAEEVIIPQTCYFSPPCTVITASCPNRSHVLCTSVEIIKLLFFCLFLSTPGRNGNDAEESSRTEEW